MTKRVAFALGALGGFNAHGIGFLKAARERGIEPSVITCTSGMIRWVASWLDGEDPEERLADEIKPLATLGAFMPFQPAVMEYWLRWLRPPQRFGVMELFDRLMPAQTFAPRYSPAACESIARTLALSATPILFNSYCPSTGREFLHLNDAAFEFLGARRDEVRGNTVLVGIDADAVRDALWLYLYGFDKGGSRIDGAYRRPIIVREIEGVDRIYVVRPFDEANHGRPPGNALEIQSFVTSMWFNASYPGEVEKFNVMRRLAEEGKLRPGDWQPVRLIEFNLEREVGYFDYFTERMEVFRSARSRAHDLFGVLETEGEGEAVAETPSPAEPAVQVEPTGPAGAPPARVKVFA
jgi:hypothetical protein